MPLLSLLYFKLSERIEQGTVHLASAQTVSPLHYFCELQYLLLATYSIWTAAGK